MEALRTEEVALQATAAKVESLAADQKEVMSETQAVLDGSVSIWSGTANAAFQNAGATLQSKLTQCQLLMDEVSQRAANNATRYGSSEGDNTTKFSGAAV